MTVPIFITCRDRLNPLKELVSYLERAGNEQIYFLDNDSAYEPLLEYLATTPHHVVRLGRNAGSLALWEARVLDELGVTGRFVLSDPDVVPIPECPLDAIEYLGEILDRYPDRLKAGLGLRIDDLPDGYRFKKQVLTWESQFWERPLGPRLYDAAVATTLALYRGPEASEFAPALRTGYPYMLRHTPWYLEETAVPEDEAFFRSRAAGDRVNHWGREQLPTWLAQAVAARERQERRGLDSMRLDRIRSPQAEALLAATAWSGEPEPGDEVRHTPWATHGWHAWNEMSPEVEVCDFVARLVRMLRPRHVIETGVGQGFLTRRIKAELVDLDQRLLCFESEPLWREMLSSLAFFDGAGCVLAPNETPHETQLAACDLCLLDSNGQYRLPEVERWWHVAGDGAVLFVHDTGNGHGPDTPHARVRAFLTELGIPGFFLQNPRGSFVGLKPSARTSDPARRLARAESELLALKNSRTFRFTAPLRGGYRQLRRPFR